MSDDGGDDTILNEGSDPFDHEIDGGEVLDGEEPTEKGRRDFLDEDEDEEDEEDDEEDEEDVDDERPKKKSKVRVEVWELCYLHLTRSSSIVINGLQ